MSDLREPRRIARVIARLNVGGPARHVVWLTEALNNTEFQSVLVAGTVRDGEEDMSAFAAAHGVEPMLVREMGREISLGDLIAIWKVWRFFVRYRPEVVHTHTAKAGTVGRAAGWLYQYLAPSIFVGRRRRCYFVHTYHGHIFHSYYSPLKTKFFLSIERFLARLNTDAIIVLSHQQFEEIHGRFGVGRAQQFRIVPLGLDFNEIVGTAHEGSALRRKLGIPETSVAVGIIGRLTAVKNHRLFLRAARRVAASDSSVRFIIYGSGADAAALQADSAKLGLQNSVIFAGTHEARAIYPSLDVICLTSRNEGTPLTLLEAMANGRPVISTAVGGVVDVLGAIEKSETGYAIRERGISVASDDEVGFAAGLQRLLNDSELRRRFAERGKVFVETAHSKERLIADTARVYREFFSKPELDI